MAACIGWAGGLASYFYSRAALLTRVVGAGGAGGLMILVAVMRVLSAGWGLAFVGV